MDSKTFGQLALQLLQQAQIPGDALDAAWKFREVAKALADGRAMLKDTEETTEVRA